jgi:hypothetical protein
MLFNVLGCIVSSNDMVYVLGRIVSSSEMVYHVMISYSCCYVQCVVS